MRFSNMFEFLTSSRSVAPGRVASRRATSRGRPLVVEPLEDRLVLTGNVDLDVAPGIKTRPQPPVIMTFVMDVAVNWFDLGWLGGKGKKTNPHGSGNNGSSNNKDDNSNGKGGFAAPGLSTAPGLADPTLLTGMSGLFGPMLTEGSTGGGNASVPASLSVTPGQTTSATPAITNPPASPISDLAWTSDAGLVTPAKSDSFFQQWTPAAGSL